MHQDMSKLYFCAVLILTLSGCSLLTPRQTVTTERDVNRLIVRNHQLANDGGYRLITTENLRGLIDSNRNVLTVDTLPKERYLKHRIPGAVHFFFPRNPAPLSFWDTEQMHDQTLQDFEELLGKDKDRPLVFYCGRTICDRSHSAAAWAVKLGYQEVYRYAGGINAWKDLPWDGKQAGMTCGAPDSKKLR